MLGVLCLDNQMCSQMTSTLVVLGPNGDPTDFSMLVETQLICASSRLFSGFCLPSSAQSLKNQNKLSMEISCQLFLINNIN